MISVIGVPRLSKGTVVLVAVEGHLFCVLLDESQEDSGRPLLGVEVVELRRLSLLVVVRVTIELRVLCSDDHVQKRHPCTG